MPSSSPVALITGANRGLGLESARQLGQQGYRVLLGVRDVAKAEAACQTLVAAGIDAATIALDVTDEASIRAAADTVTRDFGRLDVLVNNAGIIGAGPKEATILDGELSDIDLTMSTNTFGPLRVARAFQSLLKASPHGRIVNVSSGMGSLAEMGGMYPGYRLSKVALNGITRMLAAELKDDGIKVNSVCPGWVKTDMGGPGAERELPQGGASIVWAATLADDGPTGGFFRDGQPIAW